MSRPSRLAVIGFDADDTLWENEVHYRLTETEFMGFLADFAEADHLSERLLAAERRNLKHYGFGIKGFTLSMIETAIEVTKAFLRRVVSFTATRMICCRTQKPPSPAFPSTIGLF